MTKKKPSAKAPVVAQFEMAKARGALIQMLATMPEEAFGWFVMWASIGGPQGAGMAALSQARQMFPDGLGGFQPASRAAIEDLRAAAKAYIEQQS